MTDEMVLEELLRLIRKTGSVSVIEASRDLQRSAILVEEQLLVRILYFHAARLTKEGSSNLTITPLSSPHFIIDGRGHWDTLSGHECRRNTFL